MPTSPADRAVVQARVNELSRAGVRCIYASGSMRVETPDGLAYAFDVTPAEAERLLVAVALGVAAGIDYEAKTAALQASGLEAFVPLRPVALA